MLSHPSGTQFAVSALIPADVSAVYLTVDNTGITTTNANIISNLAVGGVASFGGAITTQQITATGDLIFGSFGQLNTLRFNTGNDLFNLIQVSSTNQMSLTANNINFLKSDGALTNIYTNVNIFSNTANVTRRLTIDSAGASGTSILTLKARSLTQASLFLTNAALTLASETAAVPITFQTNSSGTVLTPLQIYANGGVSVGNNLGWNKLLILFDSSVADLPSTATNFFGFGINSGTLRYQTATAGSFHKFYCGSTISYTINSTGGASGSDARWKTSVQDLTGALDKIQQLQPKSFLLNDNPNRQIGFLAQEVREICPEVVWTDPDDPQQFHFLQYDKLTALLAQGIKELLAEVNSLKARVATLEISV